MESLIMFDLPIKGQELELVQGIVKKSEVLTLFDNSIDAGSILTYLKESKLHGTSCRALIDLNVLKDILTVGRSGDGAKLAGRRTFGAAFVLFCQCANIMIDPSIAIHESPSDASSELQLFYSLDSADPLELFRVVSGEVGYLRNECLPKIEPKIYPETWPERIRNHSSLELSVLKIATLQRSSMKPLEKIMSFLTWCHTDAARLMDAFILAIFQLQGNQSKPI